MHSFLGTDRGSNPGSFDPKSETNHYSTAWGLAESRKLPQRGPELNLSVRKGASTFQGGDPFLHLPATTHRANDRTAAAHAQVVSRKCGFSELLETHFCNFWETSRSVSRRTSFSGSFASSSIGVFGEAFTFKI